MVNNSTGRHDFIDDIVNDMVDNSTGRHDFNDDIVNDMVDDATDNKFDYKADFDVDFSKVFTLLMVIKVRFIIKYDYSTNGRISNVRKRI